MTDFDPAVYDDPKIKVTLEMLAQGKTREEIAAHFGNKSAKSIDVYFYRKGFRWNGKTYIPRDKETISAVDEARFVNTKAAKIVRQLSQKQVNIRQVALKNGFATVEEMGEYMKGQGYVWDSELENYKYDESLAQKQRKSQETFQKASLTLDKGFERYQSLLDYLLTKQDKLIALLETESDGTLPRYKFRGAKANKTLALPTSLQTLLSDFSQEFNVTQRDIIEVALAEFFKKYGYEEQLNSVLQT